MHLLVCWHLMYIVYKLFRQSKGTYVKDVIFCTCWFYVFLYNVLIYVPVRNQMSY